VAIFGALKTINAPPMRSTKMASKNFGVPEFVKKTNALTEPYKRSDRETRLGEWVTR
jgi:hypothetical protein